MTIQMCAWKQVHSPGVPGILCQSHDILHLQWLLMEYRQVAQKGGNMHGASMQFTALEAKC